MFQTHLGSTAVELHLRLKLEVMPGGRAGCKQSPGSEVEDSPNQKKKTGADIRSSDFRSVALGFADDFQAGSDPNHHSSLKALILWSKSNWAFLLPRPASVLSRATGRPSCPHLETDSSGWMAVFYQAGCASSSP